MRWTRALLLGMTVVAAWPLRAEERLALVIGNGRYDALLTLPTAARDAEALAETLAGAGFSVDLLTDADLDAVSRAVAGFAERLTAAGGEATGLFYYAGYGVQFADKNYLMPADIDLRELDRIAVSALPLDRVVQGMVPAGTGIVLLDASRAHPFGVLPGATEGGLAAFPVPPGLFVASAAQPGALAMRGGAGESLFSARLNDSLARPARPIGQMFEAIARDVRTESDGQQVPWIVDALTADFDFAAQAATADDLWTEVRESRDLQRIVTFIREHPTSPHIPEAGALLSEVLGGAAAAPAAPKPAAPAPDALPADANQAQGVGGEERRDPVFFGMSIDELLLQSPIVAPIEGLPVELWQAEQCSTCHNWSKADLCAQGLRYQGVETGKGAIHPLGGAFRGALKGWAAGGCN